MQEIKGYQTGTPCMKSLAWKWSWYSSATVQLPQLWKKKMQIDFAAVAMLHSHYTNVAGSKWTAPYMGWALVMLVMWFIHVLVMWPSHVHGLNCIHNKLPIVAYCSHTVRQLKTLGRGMQHIQTVSKTHFYNKFWPPKISVRPWGTLPVCSILILRYPCWLGLLLQTSQPLTWRIWKPLALWVGWQKKLLATF